MWAGTETSRAAQIASNLDQSEVMLYSIIYKIHYKEFRIYTFCRLVVVVVGSINGGGGLVFFPCHLSKHFPDEFMVLITISKSYWTQHDFYLANNGRY